MPKDIILIAAVTIDGFIARHSHEKTTWSKDIQLFKKQTMGSSVIIGSNTNDVLSKELKGRATIVVHRDDEPAEVLEQVNTERCFIIGGGKTYARFAPFLTHVYITPHPLIFGSGVPLFNGEIEELKLSFNTHVVVNKKEGIFQYQYSVL